MSYTPINWQNGKNGGTAISAENLNHMDNGILEAHNALSVQEETLADHESKINDFANQQIPEEYLKESVDNYIAENQAGLASKEEVSSVVENVNQLSSEIVELKNDTMSHMTLNQIDKVSYIDNGFINGSGVWTENEEYATSDFISIDKFAYLNFDLLGKSGTYSKMYIAFYDAGKNLISSTQYVCEDVIVSIPSNAYYVRFPIAKKYKNVSVFRGYLFETALDEVEENGKLLEISMYRPNCSFSKSLLNKKEFTRNVYIHKNSGETRELNGVVLFGYADIRGYETLCIKSMEFNNLDGSTKNASYTFFNDNNEIVGGGYYSCNGLLQEIPIPSNATKVRICSFVDDIYSFESASQTNVLCPSGFLKELCVFAYKTCSAYSGKKLSILGDSISTFAGWIPEENETYYTGNNAGVTSVEDTWWKKLLNATGMELLVNNSWSGSAVTNVKGADAPKTGIERCEDLGENPDVIIIRMGTNDFVSNAQLGDYVGNSAVPTNESVFADAYAIMLSKVMTKYKNAEIWCCTMTQFERMGSVGFPEKNTSGDTINDWNERIRLLAKCFGAKVLDDACCGMTYFNIGEYTDDQEYEANGNGLHPNANGHSLIANWDIHQMDASVKVRY